MSNPFEDWSALNEGWDGGDIPIDEMVDNAKVVVGNSLGAVLIALAGLYALKLAVSLITGVLHMIAAWAVPQLSPVAAAFGFVGIPAVAVIVLTAPSLYRPIQLQAFEGKEFVSGLGDAFRLAREVVGKVALTTLLFGLSLGAGAIVCGVGALATGFFFCQAPYLAATTELSPTECMKRSYELNKSYAMPVIISLGVSCLGLAILPGCGGVVVGVVTTAIGEVVPAIEPLLNHVASDLLGFVGFAVALTVTGAIFTTIQSVERGVAFQR